MIKANEITNRSLKIKDVFLDGDKIMDDDQNVVDFIGLLHKVFGEGATFSVSVTAKADTDIDV